MRSILFVISSCAALSGCVGSYVDSDVAAIQTCKDSGLDWQYARLDTLGGTYHRVECVKGGAK